METKNDVNKKMPILTVEEVRKIEENLRFEQKVNSLKQRIEREIQCRKRNCNNSSLKEINELYIFEYSKLLKRPIYCEETYNEIIWLFNDGKLRTEEEKKLKQEAYINSLYLESGEFSKLCFMRKFVWSGCGFFIPLISISVCKYIKSEDLLFSLLPAFFFGFIGWYIGRMIGIALNIEDANKHKVPKNNKQYQHERIELGVGAASAVIGTASVLKHTKKAIKDIGDVENWDKKV